MRLLFAVLLMILFFGYLGFVATNLKTTVPITVFQTRYDNVPLYLVVLVAITVVVVLVGIYAVADGAGTRFENRRLRREVHKLETEINYLRTQPPSRPVGEPDALDARPGEPDVAPAADDPVDGHTPSAPVYGPENDDWSQDADDDAYTGGRAV